MIDVVTNCGNFRGTIRGFRLKCDKCGAETAEIINHYGCEMSELCKTKSIEAHCLNCDNTAVLIDIDQEHKD